MHTTPTMTFHSEYRVFDYGLTFTVTDWAWTMQQKAARDVRRRELAAMREAKEYPSVLAAVKELDEKGIYPAYPKVCELVGRKVHTRSRSSAMEAIGYTKDPESSRYKKK